MERTLFIGEQVLEMKGYGYFETDDADTYSRYADGYHDNMYVWQDDMGNINLSLNEEIDDTYYNIEEIRNICYIDAKEEVFNMPIICTRAGVARSTYRNWKSKGYKGMSDTSIQAIVDEMKKAAL